jgi:hypothetical protein
LTHQKPLSPCDAGQRFVDRVRPAVPVVVDDVDTVEGAPVGREPDGAAVGVDDDALGRQRGIARESGERASHRGGAALRSALTIAGSV